MTCHIIHTYTVPVATWTVLKWFFKSAKPVLVDDFHLTTTTAAAAINEGFLVGGNSSFPIVGDGDVRRREYPLKYLLPYNFLQPHQLIVPPTTLTDPLTSSISSLV